MFFSYPGEIYFVFVPKAVAYLYRQKQIHSLVRFLTEERQHWRKLIPLDNVVLGKQTRTRLHCGQPTAPGVLCCSRRLLFSY